MTLLALIASVAFACLGSVWALASPVGSSPDNDFHLASIWCAWGESATCRTVAPEAGLAPAPYYVPRQLDFQCFVSKPLESAACTLEQGSGWIVGRVDGFTDGNYPPVFRVAMRAFVGSDIDGSVQRMRIANVLLASVLLVFTLMICRPRIRRAVAVTWLVGIIPFGLWFIASDNPSSWAIIGVGLFWALFRNWIASPSLTSRQAWWSLLGVLVTTVIAGGARSDAGLAIVVSALAVIVLSIPTLRSHPRRLWLLLIPAVLGVLSLSVRLRSLGGLDGIRLGTMTETGPSTTSDLVAQWIRYTWELPTLLAAAFGYERPDFLQASTYIFGISNQDVLLPAIVPIFTVSSVAIVLFWGVNRTSWPRLGALATILLAMAVIPLLTLSRFDFRNMFQPRYILPLLLAFVGVAALAPLTRSSQWGRLQATLIAGAMATAGSVSLLTAIRRFTNGQSETWLSLGFTPEWWWPGLPHPLALWVAGTIAAIVYTASLAMLVRITGVPRPDPRVRRAYQEPSGLAT